MIFLLLALACWAIFLPTGQGLAMPQRFIRTGNSLQNPSGSFSSFLPFSSNSSLIYGISSQGCSDLQDIRGCLTTFDMANNRFNVLASIRTIILPSEPLFAELNAEDFLVAGAAMLQLSYGNPGILRLRQPGWQAEPLMRFQGAQTTRPASYNYFLSPTRGLFSSSSVLEFSLDHFRRLDGFFYMAFKALEKNFFFEQINEPLLKEPVILMRFPDTNSILSSPTLLSDSVEIVHLTFSGPRIPTQIVFNATGKSFLILQQVDEKLSAMEFPLRKFDEILNQQGAENKRKINRQRIDFNTFPGIPLVNISLPDQWIPFEPSVSLNFPVVPSRSFDNSPPALSRMFQFGSSLFSVLSSNFSNSDGPVSKLMQIDLSSSPPVWRELSSFLVYDLQIQEIPSAFAARHENQFLVVSESFYGLYSMLENRFLENYPYSKLRGRFYRIPKYFPYRNVQNQLSLIAMPDRENYQYGFITTIQPNNPEKIINLVSSSFNCQLVALLASFPSDSQLSNLMVCFSLNSVEMKQIAQDGKQIVSNTFLTIPVNNQITALRCHARVDSLRGFCFIRFDNESIQTVQFSSRWPEANVFPVEIQYRSSIVRPFPLSSFESFIGVSENSYLGREIFLFAFDSRKLEIQMLQFYQSIINPQYTLLAKTSLQVSQPGLLIGRSFIFQASPINMPYEIFRPKPSPIIEFHQFSLDTQQFSLLVRFQGVSSYRYRFSFLPFPTHWRDLSNEQVLSVLPGKTNRLYGILTGSSSEEKLAPGFNSSVYMVNPSNYTLLTIDLVGKSISTVELPIMDFYGNSSFDDGGDQEITALPMEIPGSQGKLRYYFVEPYVDCIPGRKINQYDTETRKFSLALTLPKDSYSRGVIRVNPYGPEFLIAVSNSSSCRGYQHYRYQEISGDFGAQTVPNSNFERLPIGDFSTNLIVSSTLHAESFAAPQARDYLFTFIASSMFDNYGEEFQLPVFMRIPLEAFKLQSTGNSKPANTEAMIGTMPVRYFLAIMIPLLFLILSVILSLVRRSRQRAWENRKAQVIAMQTVGGKAATPAESTKAPIPTTKSAPANSASAVSSV